MKIEHLRVFVDLSKTLNFTKTAKLIGITQPAVSKIIDSLERELKVKLIIRNNKQVKFTTDGRLFAEQVSTILIAYDNAVTQVRNSYQQHFDSLRIGYTGTPYEIKRIPELIHEFKEKNKKIHVYIQNVQHNELHRGLKDGNIDLIFTTKDDIADDNNIDFTPIGRGNFKALIPSDFDIEGRNIKLAKLDSYPLILMDDSNSGPELIKLQNEAIKVCKGSRLIRANNIQSAMIMVQSGLGICFLPKHIYNDRLHFVHAVSLNYSKTIYYGIAYMKEGNSEALNKFIELIHSSFKKISKSF